MLNYISLRDIQKKEMEAAAITPLEKDFYEQAAEFLTKKKEEAIASKSILAIKEYENIKKIVLTIRAKREEKLVLVALRSEAEAKGLTKEEEEMVRSLRTMVQDYRKGLDGVFTAEGQAQSPDFKKVKILKDVERYKGLNNAVYGPFKPGEEQFLPPEEAEWLLKSRLAEAL